VIIYHENGGANQRFRLQPSGYTNGEGDILYRIVGVDSGKCIDVDKGRVPTAATSSTSGPATAPR
jgi:hypothetical protein